MNRVPAPGSRGGADHDLLDQIAGQVRELATDYLTQPPLALVNPVWRLRREVFDLLEKRQRPSLTAPLYSLAGRLCALIAHASADLGDPVAAETNTRTAWLCAELADDDSLRAFIRWVQSNVAYWSGDFPGAARIANSGRRHATKGSNLLRLASAEARAWAACGDTRQVRLALDVARAARDRDTGDDQQAGVFRFEPAKAAYYASEAWLALGGDNNARLAAQEASEALELLHVAVPAQRSPELIAAARLDLCNAHLALADLDAAAIELRTVLSLPADNRTEPIVGRISSAASTLASPDFTRSALSRQLRDEIALFRAYPARRDLSDALA
ncbi:hypothetical protein KIH74_15670 [Kineosporia sp. J2-2]|uniref:XRE family transcriptional regulator n=1 Tax=Kineosporia corallincola TaxID=2835133 RepID=A0ABS5TJK1_9ACTN|nr:hypothetical protein [Kineosporia corallincola]MBT0770381.1 hypothetical protein [Kineosporia corallincola]